MGNIFNYITKYGNKTLSEMEFNEVDAAILSNIAYVDFVGILDNDGKETPMSVALEKFLIMKDIRKFKRTGIFNDEIVRLCRSIKDTLRYRNIILRNYIYKITQEEQFCALTMLLPDGLKLIVFEGTDHNLVGWEEDFAMFYKFPVPADIDAIKYAKNNISLFDKRVIVLGHSKGGHLAMTASAFSPWYIRMKIDKVYNFDGPGFRLKEVTSRKYKNMQKKLEYIIPHYSFFGLMLRHDKPAKVVKSTRKDIMAHSVFNWEIKTNRFILEPLSALSKNLSRGTILWLEMHDDVSREAIVKDVFDYIKKSRITYIGDATKLKNIVTLLKNLDELDDDTKMWIKHFVKFNVNYHLNNLNDNIEIK